jgi:hypothetical protein
MGKPFPYNCIDNARLMSEFLSVGIDVVARRAPVEKRPVWSDCRLVDICSVARAREVYAASELDCVDSNEDAALNRTASSILVRLERSTRRSREYFLVDPADGRQFDQITLKAFAVVRERQLVESTAIAAGYLFFDIKADGWCCYNALRHQLGGAAWNNLSREGFRSILFATMRRHPDLFTRILIALGYKVNLEDYINQKEHDFSKLWGGLPEMFAACIAWNVSIQVFHPVRSNRADGEFELDRMNGAFNLLPIAAEGGSGSAQMITLVQQGGNHYHSIFPRGRLQSPLQWNGVRDEFATRAGTYGSDLLDLITAQFPAAANV